MHQTDGTIQEWAVTAALVFLGVFVADLFWAWYVRGASQGHPWKASFSAVGITLCSGFVTLEYVQDRWMLIPAALGAFAGTMLPLLTTRSKAKADGDCPP